MSNKKKKSHQSVHNPAANHAKVPNVARPLLDGFSQWLEDHAQLVLLSLLVLMGANVYWDFLTFEKLFLFKDIGSDTVNIFLPDMIHNSRMQEREGVVHWSFHKGMGHDMRPRAFSDFFNWWIYLLGSERLAYALGYVEFSKLLLVGWLGYHYLQTMGFSRKFSLLGALLVAFSGFFVLGSGWFRFSSRAVQLVFLLLAFERLHQRGQWQFFPPAVAIIGMMQPFNVYLFSVFLLVYALARLGAAGLLLRRSTLVLFAQMVLLGALGLMISSYWLGPRLYEIINSPRFSGGFSLSEELVRTGVLELEQGPLNFGIAYHHYKTLILRMFSNDAMFPGSAFTGWNNYFEAPAPYMGTLVLLLFPLAFAVGGRRERIVFGLLLAFWFVVLAFPYFRFALWLFTGNYYRSMAFFFGLSLLWMALRALQGLWEGQRPHGAWLLGSLSFWLLLSALPYYDDLPIDMIDSGVMTRARLFLVFNAAMLGLLTQERLRSAGLAGLLFLVASEALLSANTTLNDRVHLTAREWESRTGYNDYTLDALALAHQRDSSLFFRVQKNYFSGPAEHSSVNDAQVQDFFSTPSYDSFNNKFYTDFLLAVNQIQAGNEAQTRWITGLSGRPLLMSLVGVKYLLSKEPRPKELQQGFDSIGQAQDVFVLRNRFALPLGVSFDKVISRSEFDQLSPFQKDFNMLRAVVVDDDSPLRVDFEELDHLDTTTYFDYALYDSLVAPLREASLELDSFSHNHIRGSIALEEPRLFFFATAYSTGWSLKVDGQPVELHKVNVGFLGARLDPGRHRVELDYHPPFSNRGTWLTFAGLGFYFLWLGSFFFILWSKRPRQAS